MQVHQPTVNQNFEPKYPSSSHPTSDSFLECWEMDQPLSDTLREQSKQPSPYTGTARELVTVYIHEPHPIPLSQKLWLMSP